MKPDSKPVYQFWWNWNQRGNRYAYAYQTHQGWIYQIEDNDGNLIVDYLVDDGLTFRDFCQQWYTR